MKKNQKQLLLAFLFISIQGVAQETFDVVQINTNMGEIRVYLYSQTVKHKQSFLTLAEANYWDSLTFNRVIQNFVAQGGCPDTPEGFGDSPYLIEPEFFPEIRHTYGAFGAGRDDNPDKLSAGCQFYIVQRKEGLAYLDDNYTIFGHVIQGMDVVDALVMVETDESDQPLADITLDVNMLRMSRQEIEALGFTIP